MAMMKIAASFPPWDGRPWMYVSAFQHTCTTNTHTHVCTCILRLRNMCSDVRLQI